MLSAASRPYGFATPHRRTPSDMGKTKTSNASNAAEGTPPPATAPTTKAKQDQKISKATREDLQKRGAVVYSPGGIDNRVYTFSFQKGATKNDTDNNMAASAAQIIIAILANVWMGPKGRPRHDDDADGLATLVKDFTDGVASKPHDEKHEALTNFLVEQGYIPEYPEDCRLSYGPSDDRVEVTFNLDEFFEEHGIRVDPAVAKFSASAAGDDAV